MSETEKAPARPRYADNWAMELLCRLAAPTVFASVDVEGLAGVLQAHWMLPEGKPYGGTEASPRRCNCLHQLKPQFFEWRHFEEHNQHVAEAIVAWLGGGA